MAQYTCRTSPTRGTHQKCGTGEGPTCGTGPKCGTGLIYGSGPRCEATDFIWSVYKSPTYFLFLFLQHAANMQELVKGIQCIVDFKRAVLRDKEAELRHLQSMRERSLHLHRDENKAKQIIYNQLFAEIQKIKKTLSTLTKSVSIWGITLWYYFILLCKRFTEIYNITISDLINICLGTVSARWKTHSYKIVTNNILW